MPGKRSRLSIDVSESDHLKIKMLAMLHKKKLSEFVLEAINMKIRLEESENSELKKMASALSPSISEIWDNDEDSAYDKL